MKFASLVLGIYSAAVLSFAQTSPLSSSTGVTIKSSTFDPVNHVGRLTFINTSPLAITAWGYCVRVENAPGDTVSHNACIHSDPFITVIESAAEEQQTHRPIMICDDCHFIGSQQEKTITAGYADARNATVTLEVVIYSDGSSGVAPDANAQAMLRDFVRGRQGLLRITQKLIDMGQTVVANANDRHPFTTMVQKMQAATSTEPALVGPLRRFKRPNWRKGDDREHVPADETGYVTAFVARQRMVLAELERNQIKEAQ